MSTLVLNKPRKRMFHLDNLRIYLTILVILHHASIAYGGLGSWSIIDPGIDEFSPIILTYFNALNQSYFMAAFFLLAGYFTPRSLEKKGSSHFIKDRLIRLGIPLLIYTTIIVNVNEYILDVLVRGEPFSARLAYEPGHLWFLQVLLVFAFIYMIYRALTPQSKSFQISLDRFPPDTALKASIVVLAVLTFAMRIKFPIGEAVLGVQPAHLVHYIFAFFVGTLAYRGDWFNRLEKAQAKRWGMIALATIPMFLILAILGGALENEANLVKFMGGVYWQSFAYTLWETIMLVSVVISLLYLFREKVNRAGPVVKIMAASVFAVYIIHQTVLYALNAMFLPVSIPTIMKFLAVSLIAVVFCFLISIPIRKIPYAQRVLG